MGLLRRRPRYFLALAGLTLALAGLSIVAAGAPQAGTGNTPAIADVDCDPCILGHGSALSTWPALPRPGGDWEQVQHLIARERFDAMEPWQRSVMAKIAIHSYESWKAGVFEPRPSLCFEPGGATNVAAAWASATEGPDAPAHFFLNGSWSNTATNGAAAGGDGTAVTLTFSFVPDGTSIPTSGAPDGPTAPSDLIAFLDGIYGTSASIPTRPWFPFFQGAADAIFDNWAALTGIRYVFEPNDDGGQFPGFPTPAGLLGALGVRGDLRIGGRFIDGQAGANILAFNYFPNTGDMVIDTSNTTFYGNTTNNSRSLRNVLAHEHGHGIGIAHVCSISDNFLMEPFINTSFDLAQEDDIRAGNRGYGDRFEFAEGRSDSSGNPVVSAAFIDPDGPGPAGGGTQFQANLSIDRAADVDWWAFSGNVAGFELDISVTPTGTTYDDDPQGSPGGGNDSIGCPITAISQTNALQQSDLSWTLYQADATTVIASSNTGGLGAAEVLNNIPVPGTGPWLLRIDGLEDRTQMYTLSVSGEVIAVPPSVTCPGNIAQECNAAGGNAMNIPFVVTDANPLPVSVTWSVNGFSQGGTVGLPSGGGTAFLTHQFPLGLSTVVVTATNTAGLSDTCSMTVTISDTTPPAFTAFAATRLLLFPARNGMVTVGLQAAATDICDPAPVITVDVFSDEPNGAAPFAPDATGAVTAASLALRMERAYPGGNGRVYLLRLTATDASGNSRTGCLTVVVPVMPTAGWILMVRAEALAAQITCTTTGLPPVGYALIHSYTIP